MLPLLWLALYGTRTELWAGLTGAGLVIAIARLSQQSDPRSFKFELLTLTVLPVICFTVQALVTKVKGQAHLLQTMSETDALTGVANRRHWDLALPRELARARRDQRPLSLALVDLDHFKRFNDSFGHQVGDQLRRDASMAWQAQLRHGDLIARYGGDEFGVILPDCDLEEAIRVIQRLRSAAPDDQTISAGIALWNGTDNPAELVARADAALYAAKRGGKNQALTENLDLAKPT